MSRLSMIYMTTKDLEEGRRIAKALIEAKLVACANFFPISSIYRWKGQLLDDREVAVIMKTRASLVEEATAQARRLHSYELPCIVAYPMEGGLSEYMGWVREETNR